MAHEKKKTNWRPKGSIDAIDGHEAWTHTGPHEINDGEVDGEVSFDLGEDDDESE